MGRGSKKPSSYIVYGGDTINNNDFSTTQESGTKVAGSDVIISSDGSIVYVGDDGQLNGNTGDSSDSGSVAIDVQDSTLESGDSDVVGPNTPPGPSAGAVPTVTGSGGTSASAGQPPPSPSSAPASSPMGSGGGARSSPTATESPPVSVQGMSSTRSTSSGASSSGTIAPISPIAPSNDPAAHRAVSISGYEDHSITVDGNNQIVLYDDSNAFLYRSGLINANTGDTDSSGLNVVDATNSIVRSGNSGDGEGGDDDEDDGDDVGDEAEEQPPPTTAPEQDPEEPDGADEVTVLGSRARPTGSASGGVQAMAVDDDDGPFAPPSGQLGPASGSVGDEDTATQASGEDVMVIGGDGYDDLGVRSRGNNNIVVYDDSNLVIGGTGKVNAQIGDSDTGGAVVMGVANSDIRAGCEGDLCPLYPGGSPR